MTTEKEKGKWAKILEGMKQIKAFFLYLNEGLSQGDKTFFSYFAKKNCYAIVGMPSFPDFKRQRNTQANNE